MYLRSWLTFVQGQSGFINFSKPLGQLKLNCMCTTKSVQISILCWPLTFLWKDGICSLMHMNDKKKTFTINFKKSPMGHNGSPEWTDIKAWFSSSVAMAAFKTRASALRARYTPAGAITLCINLKKHNDRTMKYRSLIYIYFMRSIFMSHCSII